MKAKRVTADRLLEVLTNHYVETGNGVLVGEWAGLAGCSASTVSKRISEGHGCIAGAVCQKEDRPTYSRDYPGMRYGNQSVWVYYPSRAHLRNLLKELRGVTS